MTRVDRIEAALSVLSSRSRGFVLEEISPSGDTTADKDGILFANSSSSNSYSIILSKSRLGDMCNQSNILLEFLVSPLISSSLLTSTVYLCLLSFIISIIAFIFLKFLSSSSYSAGFNIEKSSSFNYRLVFRTFFYLLSISN